MVMYDNEFETMENKIKTKDKIEPQHIQLFRQRLSNTKTSKRARQSGAKGMMGCGCKLLHRQVHEFSALFQGGAMNICLHVLKEKNEF